VDRGAGILILARRPFRLGRILLVGTHWRSTMGVQTQTHAAALSALTLFSFEYTHGG